MHHRGCCLFGEFVSFEGLGGGRNDHLMIWKDECVGDDDIFAPSGGEYHHLCYIVRR